MRSLMMFSSRKARLWALLTLLTLAATFVPGVPAHAAAATKLALANVDTTMTANRSDSNGIDQINVQAQDGSSQIDNTFASTISFTSSCDPCMAVSVNADMSSPLANNQFTWGPFDLDKGNKNFYVRWTENAVGAPRTLTVASGSLTPDSVSGITVVSNDATRLDLQNVEFGSTVGVADSINVVVKNQANQTNPNVYEGVVVFEASCGNCFTITPHDAGTGNEKQYTFAPGDNASKGFALTWTTAGNNRTFTATDSSLTTTPSETVTGIDVEAAAATTTTSSTTSSSTTTPSSTTSTSAVPRVTAAQVVIGAAQGGGPHVLTKKASNIDQVVFSFFAYASSFNGGVRVATGDVNNDNYDDIITAPGPGGGPHVKVFSGKDAGPTPSLLGEFFAYGTNFTGGVFVASGDVNNDGMADVITGADAGGGPHIKVFDGTKLGQPDAELMSFFAYGQSFAGGVRVASWDFNGDGNDDIVTGAGPGGGPHVRIFSGANGSELGSFFAYAPGFAGGVFVAAGKGGQPYVVTGAGPGGGRHVRVLDKTGALSGPEFIAGTGTQGAVPAVGEANSKANDLFFVSRAIGNPAVQQFDINTGAEKAVFPTFTPAIGAFVAVGVF